MKIGIVSDSHGDLRRLKEALRRLAQQNVRTIIHCGDIGGGGCLEALGAATAATYLVAGNMDRDVALLAANAVVNGVHFANEVAVIRLESGRQLAATHGDDAQVLGELIHSQQFAYVLCGHSHRMRDDRIGLTRVINPGALHRTSEPTAAVLDTETDQLEFLPINPAGPGKTSPPTNTPLESRRK